MGFFSYNCKCCGHPMLSGYVTTNINRWMNDVVVIENNGTMHTGSYDGYGRVSSALASPDMNIAFDPITDEYLEGKDTPACYHEACWKLNGKPTTHNGGSESSADQGYFFDDIDHAMEQPK